MPFDLKSKLRWINPEMIAALARTVAQVGSGIIAQRGWANDDEASTITGAIALILITCWGVYVRRDKALIESATSLPSVHNITMDRDTQISSASLSANRKVSS